MTSYIKILLVVILVEIFSDDGKNCMFFCVFLFDYLFGCQIGIFVIYYSLIKKTEKIKVLQINICIK